MNGRDTEREIKMQTDRQTDRDRCVERMGRTRYRRQMALRTAG